VIALFLRLGFWQLNRAEEKAVLLADIERAATEPVTGGMDVLLRGEPWRAVTLEGRYQPKQFLLDAQTHAGQVGYRVFSGFLLDQGAGYILIDRGWVQQEAVAEVTASVLPASLQSITGMLAPIPRSGWSGGPVTVGRVAGMEVVNYPTREQWQQLLDVPKTTTTHTSLHPLILRLHPQAPQGFVREWRPQISPPERHTAYAVQWFAMAFAVLLITLTLTLRTHSDRTNN